jgi:Clostripain family
MPAKATKATKASRASKATRASRTPKASRAEWTILVFLNAKNNLEPFSFQNFLQMANVGSTDAVNVVVEYGRPKRNYSTDYGGWSKTLRYRVAKGMKPTAAKAMSDLGQVNMGDGAALADFVTWGRETFPSERTMLAIWDHGQGWRRAQALTLRASAADLGRVAKTRQDARARLGDALGSMEALPDDQRVHGAFRYVSHDEDTGDKLYNREIQDALTGLTEDGPIDLIGFDACLMAMLETAYALRGLGTVMVGSEELEPGEGWSYDNFLRPLVADPAAYDAAALGRAMVAGYRDYYGDRDATTLSAIDLGKVQAAAAALSRFATEATANLDTHLPALKRARRACENYAPGYGLNSIDLIRFLDQVVSAPSVDAKLASRATSARAAVADTVLDSYASVQRQGRFGSHGLAIYFPASQLAFDNDPDRDGYVKGNSNYPVEFVERQKWGAFLQAYHARVPR